MMGRTYDLRYRAIRKKKKKKKEKKGGVRNRNPFLFFNDLDLTALLLILACANKQTMDDAVSEEIPYHITYASLNTQGD